MLKCTIEIYPYGSEANKRTIAEIDIINTGEGTAEFGNYVVRAEGKSVKINKFPRGHNKLMPLIAEAARKLSEE